MSQGPIRLLNLFHASEEHVDEVKRAIREMLGRAIDEGHCLRGLLLEDVQDPAHLVLEIDFESEHSLQAYLSVGWRQDALLHIAKLIRKDFERLVLAPAKVGEAVPQEG